MGITVAYLAECPGSASIDDQRARLSPGDTELLAGRSSFNKLNDLLAADGIKLNPGDCVKIYDFKCITLSTATLIQLLTKLIRDGITIEIISPAIVIRPEGHDKLYALLEALDGHYRFVHGLKTHREGGASRGRKQLLDPAQLSEIRTKLAQPGATATDVARDLGVARSTLFNFLERHDEERRRLRGSKRDKPNP